MNRNNPLNPFWRVEIRTPEQARIYNRLLIAKIIVQVILLCGLLALAGWSLKMLGIALLFAVAWKGIESWSRRRKANATNRG
jgi:hypothetical protein